MYITQIYNKTVQYTLLHIINNMSAMIYDKATTFGLHIPLM